jgi:hypothetical protein
MKQNKYLLALSILVLWGYSAHVSFAQTATEQRKESSIELYFKDKESQLPVYDVNVWINQEAIPSNSQGLIALPKDIKKTDVIKVSSIGYKTIQLHFGDIEHKNGQNVIQLIPDTKRLDEVVVRGTKSSVSVNSVSSTINSKAIQGAMGKSLASLLENVSGVSSIQTGTSTAKPVIHGMYGNRILMINNGARQTGQQWGLDHAPEIDKNASATIKVIKGAESVRYGSEALGGIVVLEQKTLPYQVVKPSGSISTLYGSNGKRFNVVAEAEGTMPFLRDIAWRLQGTYINSGDASTAKYVLNNTGYREHNMSATLGYKHGKLRIEGFYSLFNRKEGVMFSAQMGSEELLQERIALGKPVYVTPFSRTITYPFHAVNHHTAIGKLYFDGGKLGNYFYQVAFQNDNREENRMRRAGPSSIPVVSMNLTSFQHLFKWDKTYDHWTTELGASYLHIRNKNQAGTGIVPIIPNYTEYDFGTYFIQKYSHKKWNAEVGIRFDNQETKALGYDYTGSLYGGHHNFSNVSYNLGFNYRPSENWNFTSNLGLAWRAPHVYELYSNGSELGSGMFVVGDTTMHSEQSTKWVTSAVYKNSVINTRVDAYLQWVNGYIYDEPSNQFITVISGAYPMFKYKQTNAFFRGIDFDVKVQPIKAIEYHFLCGLIWANDKKTNNYLPFIPSFRFDHDITWQNINIRKIKAYAQLKHRFVAKQTRFNPQSDLINFTPPAYNLFGAEIGLEWNINTSNKLHIHLAADNILNKEYKEYTNRSRYYAHDMGRDVRCTISWYF